MFIKDDIITGNSSNTYGKTNEFGQYKVLSVGNSGISLEVQSHEMDKSLVGAQFHGLDSTQFKLVKAAPGSCAPDAYYKSGPATTCGSPKKYSDFSAVSIKKLSFYHSKATATHAGGIAKILNYDKYIAHQGCWECTVSYPDGSIGIMLENEMGTGPSKPQGRAKADDDFWGNDPVAQPAQPRRPATYYPYEEPAPAPRVKEEFTYPDTKKATAKKVEPAAKKVRAKESVRFEVIAPRVIPLGGKNRSRNSRLR